MWRCFIVINFVQVTAVYFTPDGRHGVSFAEGERTLFAWDVDTKEQRLRVRDVDQLLGVTSFTICIVQEGMVVMLDFLATPGQDTLSSEAIVYKTLEEHRSAVAVLTRAAIREREEEFSRTVNIPDRGAEKSDLFCFGKALCCACVIWCVCFNCIFCNLNFRRLNS